MYYFVIPILATVLLAYQSLLYVLFIKYHKYLGA